MNVLTLHRLASCSLAALALIVLAPRTAAFVPVLNANNQRLHWELLSPKPAIHTNVVNPKTKAIRYFLAADAYSTTNTANELNAVRSSFQQWESVTGTYLKFEEGGLFTGKADINTTDNTNIVYWVKDGTLINGGRDDLRGALGLSFQDFYDDYSLAEADIVLNGNVAWFTDATQPGSLDRFVEAVATHEIGHFIGLNHSPIGASTMMVRGSAGIGTQPGLSADEVAAARWIYPAANGGWGTINGKITVGGKAALGATIVAEDAKGCVVQATVSNPDGSYVLGSLPAGTYNIRVCPLDPTTNRSTLLSGADIDPFGSYLAAETGFLPTENTPVTIGANETRTQNYNLGADSSALRITRIRPPQDTPNTFFSVNTAVLITQGRKNVFVGVYGPGLPTSGADLKITGDGITYGETTYLAEAFIGINLVTIKISVAADATPGMRSFVLRTGNKVAYANGFLEVLPAVMDWNFDGLDDLFQRRYFPLWTATAAAPGADPDQDGYTNLQEYLAGTDPSNPKSFPVKVTPFLIQGIAPGAAGITLRWQSVPNVQYRILGRQGIDTSPWFEVGRKQAGAEALSEFVDGDRGQDKRFYRIEALP